MIIQRTGSVAKFGPVGVGQVSATPPEGTRREAGRPPHSEAMSRSCKAGGSEEEGVSLLHHQLLPTPLCHHLPCPLPACPAPPQAEGHPGSGSLSAQATLGECGSEGASPGSWGHGIATAARLPGSPRRAAPELLGVNHPGHSSLLAVPGASRAVARWSVLLKAPRLQARE